MLIRIPSSGPSFAVLHFQPSGDISWGEKKFFSDVQHLKRVDIANPNRCPGENLTFIDAPGLSDDSKTGREWEALSLGDCHS